MTAGIIAKQRDIVLIPFPYSDFSQYKQRPVLILSNDKHNEAGKDIICCAITSNPRSYKGSIPVYDEHLETGTLFYKSRIKPNKLFTLHQDTIIKRLARLNRYTATLVIKELTELVQI
jgi:mRNA interferase MazF